MDLEAELEPRTLAEDACCAGWKRGGDQLAYIDLSETELSVEALHADGSFAGTLLNPLQFGRDL